MFRCRCLRGGNVNRDGFIRSYTRWCVNGSFFVNSRKIREVANAMDVSLGYLDSRLFIHWYFTSSGNDGIRLLLFAPFAKTA